MKKLLYLMHIDWDWIFQRPQILAKALEEDFECKVVFPKSMVNKGAVAKKNISPKNGVAAYRIPLQRRIPFIKWLNQKIIKWTIGDCNKYDVLWVCHPDLMKYIPADYSGKVVYDCMDNHAAMVPEEDRQELEKWEAKLLERADLVLVTSLKLKEIINVGEKASLVRNGYRESYVFPIAESSKKEKYKIGYFGTVANWFDFDLLKRNLEVTNKVDYHIIGPCDVEKIYHSNIVFEGTVEHAKLYEFVKEYDALIMPFVVNDIILSVDPVKLYEYISFGKCIISVYYPEIERFEPYVYFYRNQEEYDKLIQELEEKGFPAKYTEEQQKNFLRENSWEYRYKVIKNEIENLF